jgi:hypothetical protein
VSDGVTIDASSTGVFTNLTTLKLGNNANFSANDSATFDKVTKLDLGDYATFTAPSSATFAVTSGIAITIGHGGQLDAGAGATLDFKSGSTLNAPEGAIVLSAGTKLENVMGLTTSSGFIVGLDGFDLPATPSKPIPEKVSVAIVGSTEVTGADNIVISGGEAIYVYTGGTLTLTGGVGGSDAVGKSVTVSTPIRVMDGGALVVQGGAGNSSANQPGGLAHVDNVTAKGGSDITVTAGAGAAGGAGGKASIGTADAGKKLTFEGTNIIVTISGGDAANPGAGGDAEVYTSNALITESYSDAANAIINGVTLTATEGAKNTNGADGEVKLSQSNRLIQATGGTYGQ